MSRGRSQRHQDDCKDSETTPDRQDFPASLRIPKSRIRSEHHDTRGREQQTDESPITESQSPVTKPNTSRPATSTPAPPMTGHFLGPNQIFATPDIER
jgi:hypothetical protein